MKNKVEVNEIETRKAIENINETKNWFLKKVNKIDKHLARLTKKKEKTKMLEMK
jgi:hypothetical protein